MKINSITNNLNFKTRWLKALAKAKANNYQMTNSIQYKNSISKETFQYLNKNL